MTILGIQYDSHDSGAALVRDGEILAAINEERLSRKKRKVVALFQGRMEYGPRALGHRSIPYPATDPKVNNWLNQRLRRTEFMPFAPVTLAERAEQCYEGLSKCRYAAEFMTIAVKATPYMCRHMPAVVHVDGTARPS